MYTPWKEGGLTKGVKRIVKLETLTFWQLFCHFYNFNMVVNVELYNVKCFENGWS